jgi:serine/threonine-protein kinase
MDLPPGTVLASRYQVLTAVGHGATGTVYRARDLLLGETVALKLLREDMAARRGETGRFRREARFARRVTHPCVCRIHEYVEDGPWRFFAMEFVEGSDLKLLLRRHGPLPPAQALDVALQVARGLGAIHAAGLVHTDLTARNVLCDAGHRVKLTDFGFARRLDAQSSPGGRVAGTPEYMSPEQARGEPVDQRSDVYSLGILLFEMLAGEPPFHGATPVVTLSQQIHAAPPLTGPRARRLPGPLLPVLAKALAKAPADRYRTASEMRDALLAVRPEVIALEPSPVQWASADDDVPPATSTETLRLARRARFPRAVLAAATVGLTALVAWLLTAPRPPSPASVPPLALQASPLRPPAAAGPSVATSPPRRRVVASPAAPAAPAADEPIEIVRIADETPLAVTAAAEAATEAETIAAPTAETGRLQIGVRPWALVTIDGRDVGETPLAPVALAPGVYTARFEHPAYRPVVRRVTVRSGETVRVSVDLDRDAALR